MAEVSAHDPGGKTRLAMLPGMRGDAEFSPCGRFRYWLSREWLAVPCLSGSCAHRYCPALGKDKRNPVKRSAAVRKVMD